MKFTQARFAPVLAVLFFIFGAAAPAVADTGLGVGAEARVIVSLKADSTSVKTLSIGAENRLPRHAQALSLRTGLALSDGRAIDMRTQVIRAHGLSSQQLAARLANDSEVEYAVPEYRRHAHAAPNDPRYASGQAVTPAAGQWYLRAPTASLASSINAEGAWTMATGAGVVVAVLDTGVRFDHPDLATKLYPGYDFVSDSGISNDGDGRDGNASDPGDWVTSADVLTIGGDCVREDSSWHGTQTAGLVAAAANNGIGVAGTGADVMVLPLRVLGKCSGADGDILAAMRWAAGLSVPGMANNTHVAKVINLSLGSADPCTTAYTQAIAAINAAGSMVVFSAGNDGMDVNAPGNCAGAVAVAGLQHDGHKTSYSSLGSSVALSAPSGDCPAGTGSGCLYPILTTTNSGLTVSSTNTYSDGFNSSLGTSFSAPLVAGTAALMLSVQPSLTPAQILNKLKASARAFPSTGTTATCLAPGSSEQLECLCTTATCGAGMLDANAAVVSVLPLGSRIVPVISYNTALANPGSAFNLDSARSVLAAGRTVRTYAWAVVSGGAAITSASNASTVTVQDAAAEKVTLSLTLTDDASNTATREVTVYVGGPPPIVDVTTTTPLRNNGDSSGGGALGLYWLLGLTLAVFTLTERNRRVHLASRVLARRRSTNE